jgi:large subunit ribosomal protein L21
MFIKKIIKENLQNLLNNTKRNYTEFLFKPKEYPKKDIFAVIQFSGKQYKVTSGDLIIVDKVMADIGRKIKLEKILLVGGKDFTAIGRPVVENAQIFGTIEEHTNAEKIIIFKKKKKKGYRRWKGHSQQITKIRIEDIIYEKPNLPEGNILASE